MRCSHTHHLWSDRFYPLHPRQSLLGAHLKDRAAYGMCAQFGSVLDPCADIQAFPDKFYRAARAEAQELLLGHRPRRQGRRLLDKKHRARRPHAA